MEAIVDPNFRAQRGLAIVKDKGTSIRKIVDDKYLVPSQTLASGGYVVDVTAASCTCPDWTSWGGPGREHRCKHMWAVLIVRREVTTPDGSVVVTEKRIAVRRDWSKYNEAQTAEEPHARALLRALCDGIVQPTYKGNGRPSLPLSDVIYGLTMKVWNKECSARRAHGKVTEQKKSGYVETVPSFNSILNYLKSPALTPLLQMLILESAAPLVACETEAAYAVDSTGFATRIYGSWSEEKHGVTTAKKHRKYIMAHVIAGTHTHVVTYVQPTENPSADREMLPKIVQGMAQRYKAKEISADKGYLAKLTPGVIESVGAVPYIRFKDNSVGTKGPEAWNRMWHHYSAEKDEYMRRYHRRSNVETVMYMVKQKFGDRLLTREVTSQFNEILLKFLCHNLSCLAMSVTTLGIEPKFEKLFPTKAAA
jgi:transposase